MRISVTYEDSDVAKALAKIIKDPNQEEFVKLLTPMICTSGNATNHFFKLMIGNKLPDIIPNETLCKIKVDKLGYGSIRDQIRKAYADEDDRVIVTVKEFRGYHEYSQYRVAYKNVLPDGTSKDDTTYVGADDLEVIEEF
jgi:hypothetical protein